jgi:hypothetical protein
LHAWALFLALQQISVALALVLEKPSALALEKFFWSPAPMWLLLLIGQKKPASSLHHLPCHLKKFSSIVFICAEKINV